MKRFLKIIGSYLLTGIICASIFMLTGGTKLDLGVGFGGNILIFLLITVLWPLAIYWKVEANGFSWKDTLPLVLFIILIIFFNCKRREKRISPTLSDENEIYNKEDTIKK